MRVTLKDIAARAGVSKSLVSMYLNGNPAARLQPETRERIDRAIAELGYRPSFAAQALAQGRTKMIGFVVGGVRDPYFSGMIDVILDTADRRGYQLMLFVTRGQPEKERRCLECLVRSQVDGVLYQPQLDPDLPLAQELCRIRYPLILFGQRSSQFATAWSDCRAAIRDAVCEVCCDGEKQLFLAGYHLSRYVEWFAEAGREWGATLELYPDLSGREQVPQLIREILRKSPPVVFLSSCRIAESLLAAIDAEKRAYRPRIITIYHFPIDLVDDPRIAGVIRCDFDGLVSTAANALIDQAENPSETFVRSYTRRAGFVPYRAFDTLLKPYDAIPAEEAEPAAPRAETKKVPDVKREEGNQEDD